MKRKIFLLTIIFILSFCFIACKNPFSGEDVYDVWTYTYTYNKYLTEFCDDDPNSDNMPQDGYYYYSELSDAIVDDSYSGKHSWTKDELIDYFIGRNFDESTAKKTTSWLLTVDHCFIVSRTGNTIYILTR